MSTKRCLQKKMPPKKDTHYAESKIFQSPPPSDLPIPTIGPNGKMILLIPKKKSAVKEKSMSHN